MTMTLTAAEIALCASLTGISTPTYDECSTALIRSQPSCDLWMRCPEQLESTPDDMAPSMISEGYSCTPVATYDMSDGAKGTERFCTRPAALVWLPDGRWAWKFEDAK